MDQGTNGRGAIPESWLFDAPLFIDDVQIRSLYNAVALPEYQEESRSIVDKNVKVARRTAEGQAEVSVADSVLAKLFFPISAKASVKGATGSDKTTGTEDTVKWTRVDTPERQLMNLAFHYASSVPNRVWSVLGLEDLHWLSALNDNSSEGSPKALIFLDVEKGYPVVPMAAELSNGKVVTFFDRIAAAVKGPKETLPPNYPKTDEGSELNDYWAWFSKERPGGGDTSLLLMNVVESAIGDAGRPRWIDCRVPLGTPGNQVQGLHLHIKSRELYDTGDFAYHFVHRGRKHGFRVVGTLKTGPALNVLALYEK